MWRKRLITASWVLAGMSVLALLVAAMQSTARQACRDINVEISGIEDNIFVDEKAIRHLLNSHGPLTGRPLNSIPLRTLEGRLEKNPWIRDADLFFDNNQVLQVRVVEREPLARIFTVQGSSFYIDSSGMRLPLSESVTARVPMFTGFPSDKKILSAPDSLVLQDVKTIARAIAADSFWMAQAGQIDITPERSYQIIPVLGNQVIELGDAGQMEDKLKRLYAFYTQVWSRTGFEKYARIDVRYAGQVVATRRGAATPPQDSARAMQLLNSNLEQINTLIRDSLVRMTPAVNNPVTAQPAAAPGNTPLPESPLPDAAVAGKVEENLKKQLAKPQPNHAVVTTGTQPRALMPKRKPTVKNENN